MGQAVRYLLFGEGETVTYGLHHPPALLGLDPGGGHVRPLTFLMSD